MNKIDIIRPADMTSNSICLNLFFIQRTLVDFELGFDTTVGTTDYSEKRVSKDFAFVYKDDKTLIVFPSGTEHKVAVVEITSGDMRTAKIEPRYITFNKDEFIPSRAPHGRYRRIEWAIGTDYVWVTDSSLDEVYVIDIEKEEVVTTLTEFPTNSLLSVQNYAKVNQVDMQKELIMDMTKKGPGGVEIAAIVVGSIAVLVGIVNYMFMVKMKNDFKAQMEGTDPSKLIEKHDFDQESDVQASENGINSIN